MYAFYEKANGSIISIVNTSGTPIAPEGYGYVPCSYDASELYKYQVVSGAIQLRPQTDIDAYEADQAGIKLKNKRNQMLTQSDWTQAADSPLSDAKKAEWATYRQQLRDLPANTSDPANPTWPTPPS